MGFDRSLWEKVVAFHGHECPGLAMGYRAVLAALRRLGAGRARDEELVAVAETDACGVDAFQVLAGCSLGKGNLVLRNRGKQAFTLYRRAMGEGIRVYVAPERLEGEWADRRERTWAILTAPEEILCTVSEAAGPPPGPAPRFPSVTCTACGERLAEPLARLRDGEVVCLDCLAAPGRENRDGGEDE
ncbi:formylmethanofuran dehydrogenase [Dissulfurirhabdus thermomarina]|uniref:Formylmethanofuran dehydrogenase n=1 Tax=Dissulfurirhabdus thermomarina TaxID=1765737 RepID=A0A6N9TST5_DISTH|nr:FmdE family protein [Dissulfurirhabdus thermomarina]NDY43460.1 formylmethanofuran dehydrogenase [Dissulfurirhabdus thermomarina]NMX22645.1 formylmethanofuran dehydrogenase [Dissulfurirhabdus thermomarina]